MDEGVEQLKGKSEDSGQQEAQAARRADDGAEATEQRKLLEIQSSSDSRAESFSFGQHTEEKNPKNMEQSCKLGNRLRKAEDVMDCLDMLSHLRAVHMLGGQRNGFAMTTSCLVSGLVFPRRPPHHLTPLQR